MYTDEEFWAPDGAGHAVTITFNPDGNGKYVLADGLVNDMTSGNGSVADPRAASEKQGRLGDMENLYAALQQTIGTTLSEKSAAYQNSSYTLFVRFNLIDGVYRPTVYGSFNGTNLDTDSQAAIGSGTSEYTPEGDAIVTKPNGGTQAPQYSNSDLGGSGGGGTGMGGGTTPPVVETPDSLVRFGEPYCLEVYNNSSDKIHYAYVFFADGSASYNILLNGEIYQSEKAPAGTLTYRETEILFAEDDTVVATVLDNGNKIEAEGNIYTAGLITFCVHSETEIRNVSDRYSGDVHCKDCGALVEKGEFIVTAADIANGVYLVGVKDTNTGDYTGATAMYKAGEALPAPQNGDVYVYGDYEYRYNYRWNVNVNKWESNWRDVGWFVRVLDTTKSNYQDMLSTISGEPVAGLSDTYFECRQLVVAPKLSTTAKYMNCTFGNCSKLKTVVIPNGVEEMHNVFQYCTSLVDAPAIPNTVKTMEHTFFGCSSMKNAPVLPNGLTDMSGIFWGCKSLQSAPTIPETVQDMEGAFIDCLKFVDLSYLQIPASVTNIDYLFQGCTNLKTAPIIPSTITTMRLVFTHCTSLQGEVIINSSTTNNYKMFNGTTLPIVLKGSSSLLNAIAADADNGNVTVG